MKRVLWNLSGLLVVASCVLGVVGLRTAALALFVGAAGMIVLLFLNSSGESFA